MGVFVGYDLVIRRGLYFKSTVKTEPQAQIELCKLLEKTADGRRPEAGGKYSEVL